MIRRNCGLVFGILLAAGFGPPLAAHAGTDDDVAPDEPVRLAAADGVIDSGATWGHCGPWLVDVDGDGVRDLVVGDFSGLFRFYRNVGTNQQPRYAKAVNLRAGGVDAKVPIY